MMQARPLGRPATHEDLEALPGNVTGEILDGELYVMTRPRARHARVGTIIGSKVGSPFDHGPEGPGGWWVMVEPGIELPGSPEVVPDVAGWRRDRLPTLPIDASIRVVPDWVCEILSPSTRGYDNLVKRAFYAKHGVSWLWYVDPDDRTLIASQLVDEHWKEIGVFGNDAKARIPPFDSIEIDLAAWWPPAA